MSLHVFTRLLLLSIILQVGSGCSISYSVDQSSESISGSLDSISASFESFTSISTSSGSEKKEVQAALRRFGEDIKGLTRVCLASQDEPEIFEQQVSMVAMQYGILDWENEPATFLSIGKGLREGGIAESDIQGVSFLQHSLLEKNYTFILRGFQEA